MELKTPITGWHRHGDERRRYRERCSFVCHFLAATRGNKGRGTKHETKSNPAATGEQARERWGWLDGGTLVVASAKDRGMRRPRLAPEAEEKEKRNSGNYLFGREHFAVIFISFPRKTLAESDGTSSGGGSSPRRAEPIIAAVSAPREIEEMSWTVHLSDLVVL